MFTRQSKRDESIAEKMFIICNDQRNYMYVKDSLANID